MTAAKTLAVCLRVIDYSETSQVAWFYGRDAGRVHAIAKGSKRPKTKFYGALDLAGLYEIVRIPKPPGVLDVLTEADLRDEFRNLRLDAGRFAAACYVLDFMTSLTPEGLPQPPLFDLIVETLRALDGRPEDPAGPILSFEARGLAMLGWRPRTDACGRCGRGIPAGRAYFACRDGGAVCGRCTPRDPIRAVVERETLQALNALSQGQSVRPEGRIRRELRFILDAFVQFHAERRLSSLRLMRRAYDSPAAPHINRR